MCLRFIGYYVRMQQFAIVAFRSAKVRTFAERKATFQAELARMRDHGARILANSVMDWRSTNRRDYQGARHARSNTAMCIQTGKP